jgi:hypothetical protein
MGLFLRRAIQTLGASIGVLVMCLSLFSQGNTGRILGTVMDQTGGAVANASVTVTNTQTGVARNLTSDEAGEYVAPNLVPGTYSVHVTVTGFKAVERLNILLETGKDARVDIQVTPGEVTQTVQVTEAVPLVDTTSVTLGGTLSNQTINDLPLNGRNYQNLLVLRPGVFQTPGGGSLTQTTNGLRPEEMNYMIEGLDDNDALSGQSITNSTLPSGDAATILPIDAIQEFNVEENAPAEFGRKPGAVVNVGIKSGTNNLHGTAYAFGRDGSWDARNFYNPAPQPVPPVSLEQFGATAGGPIVKNKLFYFGGFEQQRYTVGNTLNLLLPSTNPSVTSAAFGIVPAEAALAAHTLAVNPLSLNLLPLWGSNGGTTSTVPSALPNTVTINNAVGKVSYTINSHHSVAGAYFFGNGNSISDDSTVTQPQFLTLGRLRAQFVTSNWTWTPGSNWVNVARAGWTYYNRPVFTSDHNVAPSQYGLNTGVSNAIVYGLPVIQVSNLSSLGGGNNWPSLRGPNDNYDFVDQVSYLRGKHAFKFGGEVLYAHVNQGVYGGARGKFLFAGGQAFAGSTALEDFLAGDPKNASLNAGVIGRVLSQTMYAVFIQDSWRVTPKLTANFGVRWEYAAPLAAQNNLLGNWTPTAGLEQVGQQINSPYNGYKKGFAPRGGIAWDVSGKGTTVIRVGGSLAFDDTPMTAFVNNVGTANAKTPGITLIPTGAKLIAPNGGVLPGPTGGAINVVTATIQPAQLNWTTGGPVFPSSLTTQGQLSCGNGINPNPAPCSLLAVDPNLKTPWVGMWTLSVQHSLSNNLSFELAYVGNHGGNLLSVTDLNQLNAQSPAELACNHCEVVADRPYGTQYPYLQFINFLSNLDRSNYNGLQANLTSRNFHRLTFVAGYTYSHALDQNPSDFNETDPQDSLHPELNYGNSNWDIRHRFTFSVTYDLPGKKTRTQLLEGWKVNSIVMLQDGVPWSATDSTDDISKTGENGDRWNFVGNTSDFKSQPNVTIPFYTAASNVVGSGSGFDACLSAATSLGAAAVTSLNRFGCYAQGGSVLIPPAIGTFGTTGRNIFATPGFHNVDMSVFKNFKIMERLSAEFRVEFFNLFNHPEFAFVNGNPGSSAQFGCACQTTDVHATNPVLGSGGARDLQLGLKLVF